MRPGLSDNVWTQGIFIQSRGCGIGLAVYENMAKAEKIASRNRAAPMFHKSDNLFLLHITQVVNWCNSSISCRLSWEIFIIDKICSVFFNLLPRDTFLSATRSKPCKKLANTPGKISQLTVMGCNKAPDHPFHVW